MIQNFMKIMRFVRYAFVKQT